MLALKVIRLSLLMLAVVSAWPGPVASADPPDSLMPEATALEVAPPEPAPLVMKGETIIEFRANFLGHTPAERAMAARRRALIFLEMHGYDAIFARAVLQGVAVQVHGETIFLVTPGDVADLPGATMQSVANQAARLLAQQKPRPPLLTKEEIKHYAVWAGTGVAGLALLALLVWKASTLRKPKAPKSLRCPECNNADAGLLREVADTSHFWGMRKFYCDACGYKWIKKGFS